jgi:uncharacterized protein DUF1707
MDDRIRVSDADRDRVTTRLREHFGEGRLTHDELDERISAALSAKTAGDLRRVMADLPEPAPAQASWGGPHGVGPHWGGPHGVSPHWGGPPWAGPRRGGPPWMVRRRGPRLLPVLLIALLAVLLIHGGGWLLFGFFQVLLLFWLATVVGGIVFGLIHRRAHRYR